MSTSCCASRPLTRFSRQPRVGPATALRSPDRPTTPATTPTQPRPHRFARSSPNTGVPAKLPTCQVASTSPVRRPPPSLASLWRRRGPDGHGRPPCRARAGRGLRSRVAVVWRSLSDPSLPVFGSRPSQDIPEALTPSLPLVVCQGAVAYLSPHLGKQLSVNLLGENGRLPGQ